nr:MAG TPA: hypothetical protein [Caudoviricetes sp.]
MTFDICNTKSWDGLSEKYYKDLKPFSLKVNINENGFKNATIEVNSLQDIIDIVKATDEEIIISNLFKNENMTIEIYDTWRE